MPRPKDLPGADSYPHGTRSRYVTGCRCDECRAAATKVVLARDQEYRDAVIAHGTVGNGPPLSEVRRDSRHGQKTIRYSENTCPGINGELCPYASILRKDSVGGLCRKCGIALVRDELWNGTVDAGPVRKHLRKLSKQGVGYKAVADAAVASATILFKVRSGKQKRIRAETARKVLEVDAEAIADHSLVCAKKTWAMVRRLIRHHGYTKVRIAQEIGQGELALQLGKKKVLAKTELKITKLLADADGDFLRRT